MMIWADRRLLRFRVLIGISILISQYSYSYGSLSEQNFDEWLIEISKTLDAAESAREAARVHNLEFVRSISEEYLPEFFHLRAPKGSVNTDNVTRSLNRFHQVRSAQLQIYRPVDLKNADRQIGRANYLESSHCQCSVASPAPNIFISRDVFDVMNGKKVNLSERFRFNDFRWPCQWQLYNCGQGGNPNGYDMDVVSVWDKGIAGQGIVVAVVDDGVDYRHPDIRPNYDPTASFDFVEFPDTDGPLPYSFKPHGTKCAGIIGMAANNRVCGVGIVYGVKLAALRIIGTAATYIREASGLIHKNNYIDVYSNSWGPSDSGKLFRKPESITLKALEIGCEKGRRGKGNLYTFASGNGGMNNDHCGADGFACSIHTIAVGSSSPDGKSTSYSEQCTCIMLTIPATDFHSADKSRAWMIVPTLFNGCANSFRGTSSVTPLASGVFAMVLQANPNLTWRDAQYLVANTALVVDPDNQAWHINGAGYHLNPYYGFGALNALRMVEAAENWKNVEKQRKCSLAFPSPYRVIPANGKLILPARVDGCVNRTDQVLKLEHIQIILSYNVKCRGDISIRIRSPCGTVSPIMNTRKRDDRTLLIDYPFMSVFHWGEDPRGIWTLEIIDNKGAVSSCYRPSHEVSAGHLFQYELVLWGVREDKRKHQKSSVCDKQFLRQYLSRSNPGDKHFKRLIDRANVTTRSEIYYEFTEDFSQKNRKNLSRKIRRPPTAQRKVKPYSLFLEHLVMAKWRRTFPLQREKADALARYITRGLSPSTRKLRPKLFLAVRHVTATKLERASVTQNDDGESQIRDDLQIIASLLRNERRQSVHPFSSQQDAATILLSMAEILD